jgi:hypothetical protein
MFFKGLVNGSFGSIKDIIYPNQKDPETLPDSIIIHFPNYEGPQFFQDISKNDWIPISPLTMFSQVAIGYRKQFPLRLAYALTTHKTQGETMEKGVIDVGKNERSLGSTFVQFSRFKKFTDFIVKPFSFERISKIGSSKSLPTRLEEEKRLVELFIKTKDLFKNIMPQD